ncbi:uncharacterized protein LOC124932895 [Impatiens glandulifera]|uniref:uncharacterized protein LOC124932895 n=1 Tax=Impatiens glandulifera TaxID=253017 RepID=UPI001FB1370D|nr:uncharacterized protein LOC124932895 [Impatiens glandulifera]
MADLQTVCCMCGDVGFPDNLFRCSNCHHRFQHSYCSNYYKEVAIGLCDWCQSDQIKNASSSSSRHYSVDVSSKNIPTMSNSGSEHSNKNEPMILQSYAKINKKRGENQVPATTKSSKPTTRRYKLLKDVMC